MGSCSSKSNINIPPRPDRYIGYVRYSGTVYGTETYKIYLSGLTNEQIHYYILNVMNSYKCHYIFETQEIVVIHNIYPITFNNMFANLNLVPTLESPNTPIIIPSAPPSEDPI